MTSSAHLDDAEKPLDAKNPLIPPPPAAPGVPETPPPTNVPDFERLANNAARFVEQSGKAIAAYLRPLENGDGAKNDASDQIAVALTSIGKVAEHWMSDPARMAEAQGALATPFLQLWAQTYRRMQGEIVEPLIPLAKGDKRYAAPEWNGFPLYDFLRQAHTLGATWADDLVDKSDELDARTRAKAKFYLRQISSALSPANFLITNPEVMMKTLASHGENLVAGAKLLAEDMEAGNGSLRIRQTDSSQFEIGRNIATTPGKVVYRNDLIELIQYTPTTQTVAKRPLLIIPPWINKFYIMDLSPETSFIRWAIEQGTTVFVASWVNPDARHRTKTFESYMREGVLDALDAIRAATGEREVDAIGYCVGGTLLSTALAHMAATGDKRIASATFFAAQADFTDAGDIQVFIDEEQLQALEEKMAGDGYLDGSRMSMAFNMLRPNDLLWSYVVSNYMKGEAPKAFDLLYWNSDSTRLPALNHAFYLRNFYIQNKLAKGEMVLGGIQLDLSKVTIPLYFVSPVQDHIAPAASVFRGAKLFGGEVRYVLAGSGHIAGVINPPSKNKYNYWTGKPPAGTLEEWRAAAEERKGSWWPDWQAWLSGHCAARVDARIPGDGGLPILCDAPGDYVKVKS